MSISILEKETTKLKDLSLPEEATDWGLEEELDEDFKTKAHQKLNELWQHPEYTYAYTIFAAQLSVLRPEWVRNIKEDGQRISKIVTDCLKFQSQRYPERIEYGAAVRTLFPNILNDKFAETCLNNVSDTGAPPESDFLKYFANIKIIDPKTDLVGDSLSLFVKNLLEKPINKAPEKVAEYARYAACLRIGLGDPKGIINVEDGSWKELIKLSKQLKRTTIMYFVEMAYYLKIIKAESVLVDENGLHIEMGVDKKPGNPEPEEREF